MKKILLAMMFWWVGYTGYLDLSCFRQCREDGGSFKYCQKACEI